MANPVNGLGVWSCTGPSMWSEVILPLNGGYRHPFADIATVDNNLVLRCQGDALRNGEVLSFAQAAARCLREKWISQHEPNSTVLERVDLTGDFFCPELIDAFRAYGSTISHLKLSTFNVPYWKGGVLMGMFANMYALESLSIEQSNFSEVLNLAVLPQLKNLRLVDCWFLQQPPAFAADNVLETLEMLRCEALAFPPDLTHSPCLTKVRLAACTMLVSAPTIPWGSRLGEFDLFGCIAIRTVPPITNAPNLKVVNLGECFQWTGNLVLPEGSKAEVLR